MSAPYRPGSSSLLVDSPIAHSVEAASPIFLGAGIPSIGMGVRHIQHISVSLKTHASFVLSFFFCQNKTFILLAKWLIQESSKFKKLF